MTPINRQSVSAMTLPCNEMVDVPVQLDFRTSDTFEIDFTQMIEKGNIDFVSGVFIDNWDNADPVSISVSGTRQRIICPANSQLWSPILAPNPPVFTAVFEGTSTIIAAHFYNIPLLPYLIRQDGGGGFNLPEGGEPGQVLGLVSIDPYVLGWFDLGPVPPEDGPTLLLGEGSEDFLIIETGGDSFFTETEI